MFKLVDSIGDPIRLPDQDGELKPGDIAKIVTFRDGPVFLRGDSERSFGVVSEADGTHASAFCGLIIFQTDNFESDKTYKRGDLLYSNNRGIFTTHKECASTILLGMVNDEYLKENNYIEISLI